LISPPSAKTPGSLFGFHALLGFPEDQPSAQNEKRGSAAALDGVQYGQALDLSIRTTAFRSWRRQWFPNLAIINIHMYQYTMKIDRIQTGIRIERRLIKVLKALAELKDITLADLIEGIALHALEGKQPFSPATIEQIARLREIYGLDLTADDAHTLEE
jgi:hypothetical protein